MGNRQRDIKVMIIVLAGILLLLVILAVVLIINKNTKKVDTAVQDIYNKQIYISTTLPDIQGSDNIILDEFGRKTNISDRIKTNQKFNNLDFENFKVYSSNNKTSVISFLVINNNNIMVESSKFQLHLKDINGNILSIVDVDSIDLLSGAKATVTIDISGDIANVYEIIVDDVSYTMQLKEVN